MKVTPEVDGLHLVGGLMSRKEKVVPWSWLAVVRDEGGPKALAGLRFWYANPSRATQKEEIEVSKATAVAIITHPNFPREMVLPSSAKRLGLEEAVAGTFGPPADVVWIEGPKASFRRHSPDDELVKLALKSFPESWGSLFATDVAPFERGVAFRGGELEIARWWALSPSRLRLPHGAYWVSVFGQTDTKDMFGFVLTPGQAAVLVSNPSAAGWDLPDSVYSALNASRPQGPLRSS